MANAYNSTSFVAPDLLIDFQKKSPLAGTVYSNYTGAFDSGKNWDYGSTIKIPLPNKAIVNTGATISSFDDVKERFAETTVSYRYNTNMSFTSKDLTFNTKHIFAQRFIEPHASALAAKYEYDLAQEIFKHTYLFTGTAGSAISSTKAIFLLDSTMNKMNIRMNDRWLAINENSFADIASISGFQNSFDGQMTKQINRDAQLGRLATLQTFRSTRMVNHIAGVGLDTATPANGFVAAGTVKAEVSSGNTMTITGLTANSTGVFNPGDKLVFTGYYHVDPELRINTDLTFSVTVTNDTAVDADGSGDAVITFDPYIISDTANPNRNISAAIAATTAVKLVTANTDAGSTGKVAYKFNAGYVPEGICSGVPPLADPKGVPANAIARASDPDTRAVNIRMVDGYTFSSDGSGTRLDIIYYIKVFGDRIVGLLG